MVALGAFIFIKLSGSYFGTFLAWELLCGPSWHPQGTRKKVLIDGLNVRFLKWS
nr:MAG TPA: hypothetical protein [Caudoviricetes sp.]